MYSSTVNLLSLIVQVRDQLKILDRFGSDYDLGYAGTSGFGVGQQFGLGFGGGSGYGNKIIMILNMITIIILQNCR